MKYGYLNLYITAIDEDTDAERKALLDVIDGPDKLYIERLHARKQMNTVFHLMERGDVLYVYSFARFASGIRDLVNLLEELEEMGIDVVSVADNFDTRTERGQDMIEAFKIAKEQTWADPSHGFYK